MPPRITRKSTRPRASDRPMVDTVQPQGLLSFRNPIDVVATNEDAAAEMEQRQTIPGADTRPASSTTERGWMSRNLPAFRSREKYFLDIPFYRPGHSAQNPCPRSMSD